MWQKFANSDHQKKKKKRDGSLSFKFITLINAKRTHIQKHY